jgi:hypothetical protein
VGSTTVLRLIGFASGVALNMDSADVGENARKPH